MPRPFPKAPRPALAVLNGQLSLMGAVRYASHLALLRGLVSGLTADQYHTQVLLDSTYAWDGFVAEGQTGRIRVGAWASEVLKAGNG